MKRRWFGYFCPAWGLTYAASDATAFVATFIAPGLFWAALGQVWTEWAVALQECLAEGLWWLVRD